MTLCYCPFNKIYSEIYQSKFISDIALLLKFQYHKQKLLALRIWPKLAAYRPYRGNRRPYPPFLVIQQRHPALVHIHHTLGSRLRWVLGDLEAPICRPIHPPPPAPFRFSRPFPSPLSALLFPASPPSLSLLVPFPPLIPSHITRNPTVQETGDPDLAN